MPKTQRFMIACLALLLGIGIGISLQRLISLPAETGGSTVSLTVPSNIDTAAVTTAMKESLVDRVVFVEGINPFYLMEHFPSIQAEDFDGVEAIMGTYTLRDSVLVYNEEMIDTVTVADLTEEGLATFISKYAARNKLTNTEAVINALLATESETDQSSTATSSDSFVACTMDAKLCPDGSYVGRIGPSCEFAACPSEAEPKRISCTSEQKEATACIELYAPVCAAVQIQCLTTPCEPIPKTFSNGCFACAEDSVTEYTEGACVGDETAF